MKTLYLLRHAKSSWDDRTQIDFERPLNKRGQIAAPIMGRLMRKQDFIPNLIVSSPATRARQTAEIVKKAAGFAAEIIFDKRIYEAGTADLLAVLSATPKEIKKLLLVGHNPGMESLIEALTKDVVEMTTAALAEVELENDDWANIYETCAQLKNLFKPREITDKA